MYPYPLDLWWPITSEDLGKVLARLVPARQRPSGDDSRLALSFLWLPCLLYGVEVSICVSWASFGPGHRGHKPRGYSVVGINAGATTHSAVAYNAHKGLLKYVEYSSGILQHRLVRLDLSRVDTLLDGGCLLAGRYPLFPETCSRTDKTMTATLPALLLCVPKYPSGYQYFMSLSPINNIDGPVSLAERTNQWRPCMWFFVVFFVVILACG